MTGTASQRFQEAVAAFRQGSFDEAARLCRATLENQPDHAACLSLIGAIAQAHGNLEGAEEWLGKALAINGDFPEIQLNYAHILSTRGKFAEAITAFQRVIALKPEYAVAHFGLGNAFKAQGMITEAGQAFAQAVTLKPDFIDALNSLGVLFCEQKMYDEARSCFEAALAQNGNLPETLNNLGVVCVETEKFAEAQLYCERALALKPDYAAAFINLGNAVKAQGNWADAIQNYGRALSLDPTRTEARNNIGLATLHGLGDADLATAYFRQVLEQNPAHVPALTHLGITHCYRGAFDEGIACYEQALVLQPDYHEARNNLGNALRAVGRVDEAVAAYHTVLSVRPHDADVRHNLSLALLQGGNFTEGWQEFEYRWLTPQLAAGRRGFTQPQWKGEDAEGKTLLIHAEQGFGDTLQFCRYVPLAVARGLCVVLEVQPELVRLMQSSFDNIQIIGRGQALPVFDLHCPMMSLPLAFGTQVDAIPSSDFYLAPDEKDAATWGGKLAGKEGLKVGLVWAGNPRRFAVDLTAADKRRSIVPEKFLPVTQIPGIRFFNLQKDSELPENLSLENWMAECRDFADTAALISQLDLVISVDTAVAHLAAALCKPVWLLNRYDTCWRWLMGREDSPWYPTLRQFRQTHPGAWDEVIERVRSALLA